MAGMISILASLLRLLDCQSSCICFLSIFSIFSVYPALLYLRKDPPPTRRSDEARGTISVKHRFTYVETVFSCCFFTHCVLVVNIMLYLKLVPQKFCTAI